jgi:multidrug efflux pump subunit AcrA (membrane-fusion protein)
VTADQKAVDEATVTSPISGVVTAVNDTVGETVSAGSSSSTSAAAAANAASSSSSASSFTGGSSSTSSSSGSSSGFVTIDALDQLEIVAGFAEADATNIKVGEPATITFPALPNVDVAGKVVAVSNTSTVVSNVVTYNETIALVNPPAEIKDGMTADVSVVTETVTGALQLPSSAITTSGTISTVELLQNGKTTVTPVVTGLVGSTTTQIVSGLSAGDVVVEPTVTISASSTSSSSTSSSLGGAFSGLGGSSAFTGGGGFTRGG